MNKFIEVPATRASISQRKLLSGHGINDSDYLIEYKDHNGNRVECPFYKKWKSMIKRCYSHKEHLAQPTYKNCSTSSEWLVFSNFKAWMITQDWEGKELDKDILIPENKIYSEDTCIFVDSSINKLIEYSQSYSVDLPIGVSYDKINNKYIASCGVDGKQVNLGRYKTIDHASHTYRNFKSSRIIKIAMGSSDLILRDALLLHAEKARTGII